MGVFALHADVPFTNRFAEICYKFHFVWVYFCRCFVVYSGPVDEVLDGYVIYSLPVIVVMFCCFVKVVLC